MIAHLSHKDFEILLATIAQLNSGLDIQNISQRTITAASKIIAADSVAFTGISFNGKYEGLTWENSEVISPADLETFARFLHEQPLFDAYIVKRRTETLQITDLMPAKEFQQTNIYNEFYKKVGVTNQLVTPMRISDDLFMSCSINTSGKEFSERDKLILTLIAPHLANAVRNAFAHERLSTSLESACCGIIALNSQNDCVYISQHALRLLEKYFAGDKYKAGRLPENLSDWVKEVETEDQTGNYKLPLVPLKIAGQSGDLLIRLIRNTPIGERNLLLEEKKRLTPEMLKVFNLTKRETEIHFLIAQGKTDDSIKSLLGISLRTVHKHVENIYTKLGVETRVAATMKAIENL